MRHLVALQAQLLPAGGLAVRARSHALLAGDVDTARQRDRSLVRTWTLRGTLHLVHEEDVGWQLALLGPALIRGGRRRLGQLGLDEDAVAARLRGIADVLADEGPLVRGDLAEHLAGRGLTVPEGQALIHLIRRAALEGVLCESGLRGDEPAYGLLRDVTAGPPPLDRERGAAELARRYVRAYGPATPEDLAAWSGLTVRDARAAWSLIADDLDDVTVGDRVMAVTAGALRALDEDDSPPPVLLGHFDPYLLGYRDRQLVLDPAHAARVSTGGGFVHPVLLVAGEVAGRWRQHRRGDRLVLEVEPFANVAAEVQHGLDDEASDVGRFLGADVSLVVGRAA